MSDKVDKEKLLIIENNRKIRLIGMIPRYLDGGMGQEEKRLTKKQISKTPFTSEYRTYQEYEAELLSTIDYMGTDKEIPDKLIEKLLKAQRELGIADE